MTRRNGESSAAVDFLAAVIANARAQARAGQIKQDTRPCCDYCGFPYSPTRSDSRYCHRSCRQAAYRRRQKSTRKDTYD